MVTAVLFVQHATPSTIATFHDQISSALPQSLGPWHFELQIFLNNKYSKPAEISPSQVPNRYLYTLRLSYLQEDKQTISIINNTKSVITSVPNSDRVTASLERGIIKSELDKDGTDNDDDLVSQALSMEDGETMEDSQRNKKLLDHISLGCCNNLSPSSTEDFNFMLTSKLQSLWTPKQAIKGEGGFGYEVNVSLPKQGDSGEEEQEKFKLRTCNCFLHGVFKGFLIEIEHVDEKDEDRTKKLTDVEKKNRLIMRFSSSINKIRTLINMYHFPEGNLCYNVLSETKLDYLSDLCQQYCDALQF